MAHQAQLYLQLSEEFGGTKFGPFAGAEVRLGSDPARNDIVLPETLGVLPEHVKIIKQSQDSYVVAPTERTAAVFIYRSDGRPPKQITTPIALGANDGFSLVTQEGPRFIIICEMPKPKEKDDAKDSFNRARKGLSAGAFFEEIKRQGLAKVMTTQGGYLFRTAKTFIVSGAIFSPRNLIMMMMVGTGWLAAGAAGCATCAISGQMSKQSATLDEVQGDLEVCEGGKGGEDPTVPDLTQQILKDREWGETLVDDDKLRKAYVEELKGAFSREKKYRWVWNKSKSADFRGTVNGLRKFPPEVTRVLAYAAAHQGYNADQTEFSLIKANSDGKEVCARGPMAVTYNMARNLKLDYYVADALIESHIASGNDKEAKENALKATVGGDTSELVLEGEIVDQPVIQGQLNCLFLDGEDNRNSAKAMSTALLKQVGPRGKRLPGVNENYWVAARIMKFYASDWRYGYTDIDFSSSTPSDSLGDASGSQKDWVINQTASAMARAVAIPCMARLDKTVSEPPDYMADAWPTLVQCGVLRLLIERGDI